MFRDIHTPPRKYKITKIPPGKGPLAFFQDRLDYMRYPNSPEDRKNLEKYKELVPEIYRLKKNKRRAKRLEKLIHQAKLEVSGLLDQLSRGLMDEEELLQKPEVTSLFKTDLETKYTNPNYVQSVASAQNIVLTGVEVKEDRIEFTGTASIEKTIQISQDSKPVKETKEIEFNATVGDGNKILNLEIKPKETKENDHD